MSDILLSKPVLPPDWIDVSVGEPHIVRDNLFKVFDCSVYELPKVPHLYEYPPPAGYKPLVQLLEDKHHAPVVITNGAKQALGACFWALQQMGKLSVGMRVPYWALLPPLIQMHGLKSLVPFPGTNESYADSELLLLPNNPDGWSGTKEEVKDFELRCKNKNIPLIHDAAYYTRSYLPGSYSLQTIGDVQIYSISKMLGLSGLRLGYVVCSNKEFYKLIVQYMEAMTVGVSMISQVFLHDLLNRMRGYPSLTEKFENISFMDLQESKKIIKQVHPEVLEVPADIENNPGMFGWFKVGSKADFNKSKINIIDGALFGAPGMVRMNLAFDSQKMQEIVTRLNSVIESCPETPEEQIEMPIQDGESNSKMEVG